MKKLLSAITFLFLVAAVFADQTKAAATPSQTKPAANWHCLEATQSGGHSVDLTTKTGDLPARNQPTYVFACISTEEGNVCTSGDSALDQKTIGYDGMTKLKQSTAAGGDYQQQEFSFNGQPVPKDKIVASSQGKLTVNDQLVEPLRWTDYTPAAVGRKWLALNLLDPVKIEMGAGGQQQGTFTFEGALAKCIPISWDPYGVVFDSQSLEPVPAVKVTLLKKGESGVYNLAGGAEFGSLLNPIYTKEDGAFSFIVPDGTYKLDVSAANFVFPNGPKKLAASYVKAYSDIYRGEEIVQKGKIEHRDIPVDSKTTPYTSSVKLMSYFPLLDKGTNTFIVQGRVSHPLTKIDVYGKKPSSIKATNFVRTKLLLSSQADKLGQFEIKIDLNKFGPTEMVGDIEFIKTNLSTLVVTTPTLTNTTLTVEPILNYMEGYAYDSAGNVIPGATVGVYLNFSNKSSYETTADEKGFYKISSEYLPSMTYGLRYSTSVGLTIPVTTSTFIAKNAKYLETQKTNLYGFRDKKGQVFKTPQKEQLITSTPNAESGNRLATAQGAVSSNLLVLAIVGLLIAGVVIVILAVSTMKKNQPPPPPPIPPTGSGSEPLA